jgi:hypothetical protein
VVTVGETVTLTPVRDPGFQVKEIAPEPVSVAEFPAQIAVGELEAVTVGFGFTVNETVRVLVQLPLAPVTVYTVVDAGDTVTLVPDNPPGFQV